MKLHCPVCDASFPSEAINVKADVAHCSGCGETFRVSSLLGPNQTVPDAPDEISPEAIANPPKGAWFKQRIDGNEAGATLRSGIAFFLVPFSLVWVGGSMGGIYGSQIAEGQFDWFRSLFGIPFLIGSLFLIFLTLSTVFGKVVVTSKRGELKVFTGIGWVGRVKTLSKRSIRSVHKESQSERSARGRRTAQLGATIVIEGERRVNLTGLSRDRADFMLNAIRFMCLEK